MDTRRNEEIAEFLSHHVVEKFAILDDWSDADLGDGNFFLTKFENGLTKDIADLVIVHLGSHEISP